MHAQADLGTVVVQARIKLSKRAGRRVARTWLEVTFCIFLSQLLHFAGESSHLVGHVTSSQPEIKVRPPNQTLKVIASQRPKIMVCVPRLKNWQQTNVFGIRINRPEYLKHQLLSKFPNGI